MKLFEMIGGTVRCMGLSFVLLMTLWMFCMRSPTLMAQHFKGPTSMLYSQTTTCKVLTSYLGLDETSYHPSKVQSRSVVLLICSSSLAVWILYAIAPLDYN